MYVRGIFAFIEKNDKMEKYITIQNLLQKREYGMILYGRSIPFV